MLFKFETVTNPQANPSDLYTNPQHCYLTWSIGENGRFTCWRWRIQFMLQGLLLIHSCVFVLTRFLVPPTYPTLAMCICDSVLPVSCQKVLLPNGAVVGPASSTACVSSQCCLSADQKKIVQLIVSPYITVEAQLIQASNTSLLAVQVVQADHWLLVFITIFLKADSDWKGTRAADTVLVLLNSVLCIAAKTLSKPNLAAPADLFTI
jgi:hypothetical protein